MRAGHGSLQRAMALGGAMALLVVLWPAVAAADPGDGPGQGDERRRPPHGQWPAEGRGGTSAPAAPTEDGDDDGIANNLVDEGDNAHPSGKDRSVERGRSGNQGKARGNPDGGEVDQPGGSGGVDVVDQDGNNGCGNDDDFEDDNRGNCDPPGPAPDPTPPSAGAVPVTGPSGEPLLSVPLGPGDSAVTASEVLGLRLTRPPEAPSSAAGARLDQLGLAGTGSAPSAPIALAAALIAMGVLLVRARGNGPAASPCTASRHTETDVVAGAVDLDVPAS